MNVTNMHYKQLYVDMKIQIQYLTFTDGNSPNVKELYLRTPTSIVSVVLT